ncbi:MAG: hypothetical protein R3C04_09375 [Hyphomonas sp.]
MSKASRDDSVVCETRTIQQSNVGTCRPGYTVTSCTQTRFTYRAGGPSILREINDQQCRFQDKVLEMQVRCCANASMAPTPMDELIKGNTGGAGLHPAARAVAIALLVSPPRGLGRTRETA